MKYITTAFSFSVALAVMLMAPSSTFALSTQDNGNTAGSISTPATQDNGNTAGSSAPATQDNGNTAGKISTPSTQDNGNTAGTVAHTPATQDNGNTAGTISTPSTQDNGNTAGNTTVPPTQDNGNTAGTTPPPANNGGGGIIGPGGSVNSSGGGSSNYSSGGSSTLPLLTNIADCDYLTSYLKIDHINPPIEVTKLQNFLKSNEGMNIAVTGIFDQATFDAVSAFQVKYTSDVLTPWGISGPTGYVYYTTKKKVNELYCKKTFALTPAQIAEIEAYRTGVINGSHSAVTGDVGLGKPTSTSTLAIATSTTNANGTSTDGTQVASVGKTSIASKIWNFIKRIFGR